MAMSRSDIRSMRNKCLMCCFVSCLYPRLKLCVSQGSMGQVQQHLLEHKLCSQCQQLKPVSHFSGEGRSVDGYSQRCRDCRRLKQVQGRLLATHVLTESRQPPTYYVNMQAGQRANCCREGVQEVQHQQACQRVLPQQMGP